MIEDDHPTASRYLRRCADELAAALKVQRKIEYDNHHNALLCPYCNPDNLVLVAALTAGGWQDIASVPKDGPLLLCRQDGSMMIVSKTWRLHLMRPRPMYWCSLPSAPTETK